jgi:hypothetical protein
MEEENDGDNMTTSQRTLEQARSYLEQYQAAVRDLDYYASRIETLEARITSGLTPTDARAGWTGEWTGRAKDGRGRITTRDPDELTRPRKVMAVPQSTKAQQDPKAGERLLVALVDQQIEYELKACDATVLCREIEDSIDRHTVGNEALVLKYRYIEGLTFDQVGRRMDYSNAHIRRLIDKALDRYAKGWGEERE